MARTKPPGVKKSNRTIPPKKKKQRDRDGIKEIIRADPGPLTTTKDKWHGGNYGGPMHPCFLCGHYGIHTVMKEIKGEDVKICIVAEGKPEVDAYTKVSCRYFQMKSYFTCKDHGQMVAPEACAYRFYNDIFPVCEGCEVGDQMVDYVRDFLEKEMREIDEVREELSKR